MTSVAVSIGTNIEREKNIRAALAALGRAYGRLRLSSVYANPAVGFEGPEFFNLALVFDTVILLPRSLPLCVVSKSNRVVCVLVTSWTRESSISTCYCMVMLSSTAKGWTCLGERSFSTPTC